MVRQPPRFTLTHSFPTRRSSDLRPVADLLLDVRTASGQQRYQVILLTQAGPESMAAHSSSALRGSGQQTGMQQAAQKSINVRPGDTMFAIALRNAVPGVSVYQMMMALQRANPGAFIHDKVTLVQAGATRSEEGRVGKGSVRKCRSWW